MPRFETLAVHAGEPDPRIEGAVSAPIFQSATFEYDGEDAGAPVRYARYNNTPTHQVLHDKLAALEGTEAALATASGMAAIASSLLAVLQAGDHLLVQPGLYGGTHQFVTRDLAALGIEVSPLAEASEAWEGQVRPATRAVYAESITNPLMQVTDLERMAALARQHDLVALIDNTFATPVNFRPAEAGFDLVLHSATKYLNGHSDLVAGAVMGSEEHVARVEAKVRQLGGSLDPHACFLLHRGLKTLALRIRQQNANALALARFLSEHDAVRVVHYPGLESHPQHGRARALFSGFGGMLSFEPRGGVEAARRLMGRLRLPVVAPSLGGVETLITRPVLTSHRSLSPEERRRMGLSDALVRVSVGVEATEDLLEDFEQAFAAVPAR